MEFVAKHTSDKFCLIDNVSTSIRDVIAREVVSNILVHRDICELWLNIESILNSEGKEEVGLFSKYFTLDGVNSFKDTVFLQVADLKQALEVLKEFYESKTECYESDFSLILLRVSYNAVLLFETK